MTGYKFDRRIKVFCENCVLLLKILMLAHILIGPYVIHVHYLTVNFIPNRLVIFIQLRHN